MDFDRRETVLVNTEIGNMNSEDDQSLQELFCQLGKAYFEGAYEDPLPQLLPLFNEISEILKKYEKQELVCASCGAELEEGVRFCDACGAPVVQQKEEPQIPLEPVQKICSNCGNILRPTAKFCGACGMPTGEI